MFFLSSLSLGVFSLNFGEGWGPQMCTFGVLWLSCEAPTSFVRVEPQPRPIISVFDLVDVSSTFVGVLLQSVAIIWGQGDIALASPAMSRSLGIVSRNLAPATCDAVCSVNTAPFPLSSLTLLLPAHDSLLVSLEMFCELGVFEMAEVHEGCEMDRLPVLLRLLNHVWLGFGFLEVFEPEDSFTFSHPLSTLALAPGMFIASFPAMGLCTRRQWKWDTYPYSEM